MEGEGRNTYQNATGIKIKITLINTSNNKPHYKADSLTGGGGGRGKTGGVGEEKITEQMFIIM